MGIKSCDGSEAWQLNSCQCLCIYDRTSRTRKNYKNDNNNTSNNNNKKKNN